MRKILFLTAFILLASSCGGPSGGYLDIIVSDPKTMISIDEAKPIQYSELKLPLDLPANPHKITVTWPETGDTTTEYVEVMFGKTVDFVPKPPILEPVEITASIPCYITAGFQDLGHSEKIKNPRVYGGNRRFEIKLDGFEYRWSTEVLVGMNSRIRLEPGTDSKTGALYIKSETAGVEIAVAGTSEKQIKNNGSVFIPGITPGIIEITEKSNPKSRHHVAIEAGKVTRLNFKTGFSKTRDNATSLKTFGMTTLYVCWGNQTTSIDLTGSTQIDSYNLDKLAPFRPSAIGPIDAYKFLVCQDDGGFGASQVAGAFPESLQVERIPGAMAKNAFQPDPVQQWTDKSDDGAWWNEQDMIYGPGGYRFALGGFEAGCWDTSRFMALATKIDFEAETFEVREAPLSKSSPVRIGNQEYKGIGDEKLKWVRCFAFYDAQHYPLALIATSSWLSILPRDRSSQLDAQLFKELARIDMPCHQASFHGKRFLSCKADSQPYSLSYVVDTATGAVHRGLVNPSSSGQFIVCNRTAGANAGIVYKISGNGLTPVWAGLFRQ